MQPLESTDELQTTRGEKAVDHPTTNRVDGTAVTKVLAEILEPAPVRDQGRFGLNDYHVPWPPLGSDLKHQARNIITYPGSFNPGVNDRTAHNHFRSHPQALLSQTPVERRPWIQPLSNLMIIVRDEWLHPS